MCSYSVQHHNLLLFLLLLQYILHPFLLFYIIFYTCTCFPITLYSITVLAPLQPISHLFLLIYNLIYHTCSLSSITSYVTPVLADLCTLRVTVLPPHPMWFSRWWYLGCVRDLLSCHLASGRPLPPCHLVLGDDSASCGGKHPRFSRPPPPPQHAGVEFLMKVI